MACLKVGRGTRAGPGDDMGGTCGPEVLRYLGRLCSWTSSLTRSEVWWSGSLLPTTASGMSCTTLLAVQAASPSFWTESGAAYRAGDHSQAQQLCAVHPQTRACWCERCKVPGRSQVGNDRFCNLVWAECSSRCLRVVLASG